MTVKFTVISVFQIQEKIYIAGTQKKTPASMNVYRN